MRFCGPILAIILPCVFAAFSVRAQTNDLLLVESPRPLFGTFWSLQKWLDGESQAPLPWNPSPDLDLYACTNCSTGFIWYFYDDRSARFFMLSEPPPEPGGGGDNPDPGVPDGPPLYSTSAYLCLFPPHFDTSGIILTLTNGDPTVCYDIYATTNLGLEVPGLNRTNWAWLGRLAPGQITFTNDITLSDLQCYYRLGLTNDCDGDSLPDAYELLVSHTAPCGYDFISSDGYGTPDGWYLLHNLDPRAPGIATQDANHDGLPNWQEYLHGSDPRGSPAFTIWVGTPSGASGLP
jgi:hypothetical protein